MNQSQLLLLFSFGVLIAVFARQFLYISLFRKVTFSMILIAVVLISFISLGNLPVELMPNISYGSITIYTDVRGGMPSSDVERLVSIPIEEAMSTVDKIRNIISSSKRNKSIVTLEFDAGMNMDLASLDVRERFLQIKEDLPKNIEKPIIARYEESDTPVYIIALTSQRKSPEELRILVEEKIKDQLMRVEGVANVEISGGRARKIIANIDETHLITNMISMNDVVSAIESNNLNMLVGQMKADYVAYGLRTLGAFNTIDQIENLGVKLTKENNIIRLSDIGSVEDSYMEAQAYSRLNSKDSVTIYIQKETTANTITTNQGIKKVVDEIKTTMDKDIEFVVISDQAKSIIDSVNSIKMSMFSGMIFVILVLGVVLSKFIFTRGFSLSFLIAYLLMIFGFSFFDISNSQIFMQYFIIIGLAFFTFLALWYHDYRPAFFIALTMPLSLLITISLMYVGKITINIMSLSGLVLGIGLLVDNSIVIVENFLEKREIEPDRDFNELIQESTEEMIEPVLGSTLTTVVVFLSFSFLEKKMQLLYADIAFSVTASLFASLFCSLGVVPMLMSYYERPFLKNIENYIHRFCRIFEIFFELILKFFYFLGLRLKNLGTNLHKIKFVNKLNFVKIGIFLGSILIFYLMIFFAYKKVLPVDKFIFVCIVLLVFLIGSFSFVAYSFVFKKIAKRAIFVVLFFVLLCGFSFYEFFYRMPKDFISSAERSQFTAFVELASGVKVDIANEVSKKAEMIIENTEEIKAEIQNMSSKIEGWTVKIYVNLVPRSERQHSTQEVIEILREKLADVGREYDGFVYFSEPQEGKELFIDLYGYDYDELSKLAMDVSGSVSEIQGFTDVKIRYKPGNPELSVWIDQNKAELFGLTIKQIADSLHAKLRGLRATEFRTKGDEIETVVRLIPEQAETLEQLRGLYSIGKMKNYEFIFPLEHLSEFTFALAPSEIWHRNKSRMIQVSGNIGKMSLEEAANKALEAIDKIDFPKGYYADIGGDYEDLLKSHQAFKRAILITIFLVFAVMACIFESVYQPFIIMFTVLLSIFGAIAGLIIANSVVSSGVLIGMLMLGGIVVNNGIILISSMNRFDFTKLSEDEILDNVINISQKRIRPVFMTTFTTICGLLPMVLDKSESSVMWRPFAITVIGGLATSTVLTLFVVPMIYFNLEKFFTWIKRKFKQ